MSLQDITITSSINSIATQSYGQRTYVASTDNQSFPIETITGSSGGVWPNFVQGTNYTVDLVVNVTQSWSGVNDTIAGLVPFVHNTMEEFIDGEFSGSNYVVSDGNLNDAQCEQFLTVSAVPVAYSVFPFPSASYGALLDRYTSPNPGQIYIGFDNPTGTQVRGRYAKIARIDSLGNNNTLSLQELKQFSYTDSNAGKIIFTVININEYQDYYFYEVTSNLTTLIPFDDNRLNFSLSSSYTGSLPIGGLFYTGILSSSYGSWTTYDNPLNNFNTENGFYNFNDTPNFEIFYTSSITIKPTVSTDFQYAIVKYDNILNTVNSVLNITPLTTYASPGPHTITLSGSSRAFTSNISIIPVYYSTQIIPATASFFVTQSQTPESATSSFVIEPYLLSNFAGSDCDVLLNNYSQNDINNFYRRVLYDDGGVIPSNFQQIISGTAEFAEITDYLYSAQANTLPRYEGVRTTSPGFNLPSINGLSNEQLSSINNSLSFPAGENSTVYNVEQTTTYFAYFTGFKPNWPIYKNTTSPIVKYLIREDGEIFNPTVDDISYYNLQGSFERGKYANISLLNNFSTLFNTTQSILLSGQSYIPVLYTISSSTPDAAYFANPVVIDFANLQNTAGGNSLAKNYDFYAQLQNAAGVNAGNSYNLFSSNLGSPIILRDSASGYNPQIFPPITRLPNYQFTGVPSSFVNIVVQTTKMGLTNPRRRKETNISLELRLYNSLTGDDRLLTSNSVTIGSYYDNGTLRSEYKSLSVQVLNFEPQINDEIYAIIKNNGNKDIFFLNPDLQAEFTITPLGLNTPAASGILWTTGSAYDTVLTSSDQLGAALIGNYKQVDIPGSGFDPIEVPCVIFPNDEIRFEYDEALTYTITAVNSTGSIFYLTLDRAVPPYGFDLNHFTIRRKVKDAITGITLDTNLLNPIYEGFLLPQYPSFTIKRDLSTIINDLSQNNLI